jgi:hypothetical protein
MTQRRTSYKAPTSERLDVIKAVKTAEQQLSRSDRPGTSAGTRSQQSEGFIGRQAILELSRSRWLALE